MSALDHTDHIDDQDLPFLHDVVHVALVQRVGAEELVHDVELLALCRILALDGGARLELLLRLAEGLRPRLNAA